MTEPIRVPITLASKRGVSGLAALAESNRVVLTSHGRATAVVDDAARIEEDIAKLRGATQAVLDAAGKLVAQRSNTFSLNEAITRLGFSVAEVRARANDLSDLAAA